LPILPFNPKTITAFGYKGLGQEMVNGICEKKIYTLKSLWGAFEVEPKTLAEKKK
jgi:hypothetical protein